MSTWGRRTDVSLVFWHDWMKGANTWFPHRSDKTRSKRAIMPHQELVRQSDSPAQKQICDSEPQTPGYDSTYTELAAVRRVPRYQVDGEEPSMVEQQMRAKRLRNTMGGPSAALQTVDNIRMGDSKY
ncbi:hypothetical protein TNCT_336101 [Trichonephila clavata]|uniref:Uncharacterized protein n=1 Tax=Trichonephila clavata TaxID=2740835 RepID=A0A8X6HH92_TRICU|nr:hypothetical protein TNCT_336101 [Trichonephila clavata]